MRTRVLLSRLLAGRATNRNMYRQINKSSLEGVFIFLMIVYYCSLFPTSLCGVLVFFCALPPASVRPTSASPTHSTHTSLSHSFVTPLCDTPLFDTTLSHTCLSHHFVSHLSFTHTHLCHTPLFHTPFAHNFVIHSLTHTTLLHTTLNSQVSTVKTEVFFCIFSCLCKTASTAGEPFTETVTLRFSLDFAFY